MPWGKFLNCLHLNSLLFKISINTMLPSQRMENAECRIGHMGANDSRAAQILTVCQGPRTVSSLGKLQDRGNAISIYQVRELRLRRVPSLIQGHKAHKRPSQDANPGLSLIWSHNSPTSFHTSCATSCPAAQGNQLLGPSSAARLKSKGHCLPAPPATRGF